MSAQPANTEIQVYRRVRVQAANERHDSLKQMGRLRAKYVVIPAEEIRVLETKDSLITDAWRYGHPVTRYSAPAKATQTVYNNVDGLAMPVRLTVEPDPRNTIHDPRRGQAASGHPRAPECRAAR